MTSSTKLPGDDSLAVPDGSGIDQYRLRVVEQVAADYSGSASIEATKNSPSDEACADREALPPKKRFLEDFAIQGLNEP